MRITRTLISVVVAALVAATSLLLTPGSAAAAAATAVFTKTANWGSGFEGKYTITNSGSTAVNGWSISFDMPSGAAISSSWDTLMTRTGQKYTFGNVSWNGNLAPGASVTFGFIGSPGSAEPSNCTINGSACGGTSIPVPGKPGAPSVTGTTNSAISLSWGASSGTVTGYRVYEGSTVRATVTGTSASIGSLGTCESHTYTVKAYNANGESPASDAVTGKTTGCSTGVPGKVGTVSSSAITNTSATLTWPAASGTVTGYRVYEGTALKATVTGTSATISGLTACDTYSFTVRAYNGEGDGPASDAISVTTTGCGGDTLPKHFLTGYWHNFTNPAVELKLAATPNEYDLIAVAFAEATSTPGQLTFGVDPELAAAVGGYTDAQFKADIQALHARGKKVILSVGGELGRVQVASSSAATQFADSAYALMQEYGFDGVDIDLENGLNATYMAQALRQLRAKVGSSLIITMAPQTIDMQSPGMTYFQLALSIKDILTVVHTQYYNSGTMLGCDQGQAYGQGTINFMTALACIPLENGLRPDQIALGLPAGPGAAGGGMVSPSVVNQALTCLATRTSCGSFVPPRAYPGIRGAMTWSINWDASNNWNFSKTVKPHLATLP
ncbi:cellulose binding domain-containing protein [Spongiactinospora sp. TRM90649]|uniref:cellulose binding domain-containing protein n=1 Tax=Spongiactinospora sp. TRM90649 TaxID=3031114 RepID=UPI0023F7FDA0|nr:cellulose binding domain-containing protein [Spongiactinospora sp. TRM90649]MDF5752763.1 cellulose binding domain-containing protein [Spongiactinospora sp. TRM90649]